jgi:outer membrane protein assembly factor BamB
VVNFVFLFLITTSVYAGPDDWTHYGHFSTRQSIAVDGPNIIDESSLIWDANDDPQDPNYGIEFETASSVALYNGLVYGYARYYNEISEYTNSQIVAYDANSGELEWATIVDKSIWDSWSSPCVDTKNHWILIGSGDKVFALDAEVGTIEWTTTLEKNVVNASVCTALDIPCARAFITDYDGFGTTGKLYCINLDPNEPGNPYDPGLMALYMLMMQQPSRKRQSYGRRLTLTLTVFPVVSQLQMRAFYMRLIMTGLMRLRIIPNYVKLIVMMAV